MTCHVRRLLLTANFAAPLEIECDPPTCLTSSCCWLNTALTFLMSRSLLFSLELLSHISLSF